MNIEFPTISRDQIPRTRAPKVAYGVSAPFGLIRTPQTQIFGIVFWWGGVGWEGYKIETTIYTYLGGSRARTTINAVTPDREHILMKFTNLGFW